jgi:4,5-epoxidase
LRKCGSRLTHGNESLLDSYAAERLPVIKNVIATTDLLTKVMGTPNKLAQSLRDTFIPMVSRLAPFQHAFVQRLSELGIAYPESPIVEGPGKRFLDDSIRGGTGITSRFLLMLDNNSGPALADSARQLCDSLPDIVELRRLPESASAHDRNEGIFLVRPDGYIAYEAHIRDGVGALASVRSLLERQTSGSVSPDSGAVAAS